MSNRLPRPAWYHLHVYFDSQTLADAQRLRQQLLEDGLPLTYVGQLIPYAIGPHPQPMFELHAPESRIDLLCARLDALRGDLSVLVHPVQADELAAHTVDAR